MCFTEKIASLKAFFELRWHRAARPFFFPPTLISYPPLPSSFSRLTDLPLHGTQALPDQVIHLVQNHNHGAGTPLAGGRLEGEEEGRE